MPGCLRAHPKLKAVYMRGVHINFSGVSRAHMTIINDGMPFSERYHPNPGYYALHSSAMDRESSAERNGLRSRPRCTHPLLRTR